MLIDDQKVQTFPGAVLKRFGVTPAGHAIFRCAWSESRLHLVGGRWPDGSVEYRLIPRYPFGAWVLEKWLSADEWGGPRSLYEATMRDDDSGLVVIPYPVNGEYEHCYTFPNPCTISMIESVCEWIQAGRNFTPRQLAAAHMALHDHQKRQWSNKVSEVISESQQAFGNRMSNINPAKLTEEKMVVNHPPPLPVTGDGKPFQGE